jgi:hypothetical protein
MNRRNFIGNLIVAGATFAILPGAGRLWKATRVVCDPFEDAFMENSMLFNPRDFVGKWSFIMESLDVNSNPVLVELS